MKFPIKENDITALAEQMIAGLTEHASDFPSVTVADLQAILTGYKEGKQLQEDTKGQLRIATVAKSEDLDELITQMKNDLKKAEVDSTTTPQNLYEIGWGPRNEPTPIQSPQAPTNLHPVSESTGEIWLSWDKPETDTNRPVRNYLVERAEMQQDNSFGPWTLVETVYNNEVHLLEQPSNLRMLFRVKAANAAGMSVPSNTVLVVLP